MPLLTISEDTKQNMASSKESIPYDISNTNQLNEDNFDEVPLWKTALDPYGRRSMAFRRKKTGKIVTATELNEEQSTDRPILNYFRRQDRGLCWSLCESIRPGPLRTAVQWLSLPLMLVWIGYSHLMLRWDAWRYGAPHSPRNDAQ